MDVAMFINTGKVKEYIREVPRRRKLKNPWAFHAEGKNFPLDATIFSLTPQIHVAFKNRLKNLYYRVNLPDRIHRVKIMLTMQLTLMKQNRM